IVRWIMRKIQKRAGNQTVNALIQGTCATLAKRSIVRTILHFRSLGWGDREFRFLIPIHDELVWSVHQDLAVPFIRDAHRIMVSHDDI
ncbi:DNA polymerase, partial [Klebsiella aerogenes]